MTDERPLLYLDVDGVINDLHAVRALGLRRAGKVAERFGVDVITSHGYRLAIPRYMPELIGELDQRCDIVWCTTWRLNANDEIAAFLGVGPYEALDPDGASMTPRWKPSTVANHAREDIAAGRRIIWIEDFYRRLPTIEGIHYVDTGKHTRLRPEDIPADLLTD